VSYTDQSKFAFAQTQLSTILPQKNNRLVRFGTQLFAFFIEHTKACQLFLFSPVFYAPHVFVISGFLEWALKLKITVERFM
jgi:hypothetical protein